MVFPLTFFLNLGELLFFPCLLFTHKRKIESDLPPWTIVEERVSHKNTIEHFPIEKRNTDVARHSAGCTGRLQMLIITSWKLVVDESPMLLGRSVLLP